MYMPAYVPGRLPWCICTTRPWYREAYPGVYTLLCTGRHTLVYIPYYTTLGIPHGTLSSLYMLSAVGTGARLPVEEALGSS